MSIWISNEELDALEGLRHVLVRLYIFGVRRYMDSATRIVGIKRGISYQSLIEEMFEEPIRGIKLKNFSRQQARRAVKALEKAGLVEIQSTAEKLILKCILAPQGKSVQNKADTKPTSPNDPEADTYYHSKNPINIESEEDQKTKADTEADRGVKAKADTPLLSIYKPYLTYSESSKFDQSQVLKEGHQWESFLVDFCKFQFHQIKTVKVIHMCMDWAKEEATLGDVIQGIECAEAKLGKRPDTPLFYKNFVDEAIRTRKAPKTESKAGYMPRRKSADEELIENNQRAMEIALGGKIDAGK